MNFSAPAVPREMFECKACTKVFTFHQALGGHRASHKKVKGCFAAKLDIDVDTPLPYDNDATTHDTSLYNSSEIVGAFALTSMVIVPFENASSLAAQPLKKKPKVHECSICHRCLKLRGLVGSSTNNNNNIVNDNGVNSKGDNVVVEVSSMSVDEEVHSEVKLAKLSELKDINGGEDRSLWLQIGIGSSVNEGSEIP